MSTATSIAQFMVILSGGTNPALLRNNQNSLSKDNVEEGVQNTNIVNFENLLNEKSLSNLDVEALRL